MKKKSKLGLCLGHNISFDSELLNMINMKNTQAGLGGGWFFILILRSL